MSLAIQSNSPCAPATTTPSKFVAAFSLDDHAHGMTTVSNNGGMAGARANSGMGLQAASHVSMDNTPMAHEYQPLCHCADCQTLLHEFTAYDVLDAYVCQHLNYEADVTRCFGFVPCVGGPYGNVSVRFGTDPVSGERTAEEVRETSMALVFHHHVHHMKPVPVDVQIRSHKRFYEPAAAAATNSNGHSHNNNNGGGAPHQSRRNNAPSFQRHSHNNNFGAAAAAGPAVGYRSPSHRGSDASIAAAVCTTAFATHNNTKAFINHSSHHAAAAAGYNNHNNSHRTAAAANHAPLAAPLPASAQHQHCAYYTQHDAMMTANAVVYTGAARLGA